MTKHETIMEFIRELQVGTKVSVRSLAGKLNVSEGTAYRAIKSAELAGLVSTVPRVGTIRIEKVHKKNIEKLTYAEVVNIVDGQVLGGRDGLKNTLNRFVIGAMTIDAMKKYISPGNLLIVGNREEAHRLALENGSAVLITGGFGCSDEVKDIADKQKLPIITSSYDTFTIATMINKAISERLVKKEIILVEDVMNTNPVFLHTYDTVKQWKTAMETTGHTKFPILNDKERLVGIVTAKDLESHIKDNDALSKVMTKDPITVTEKTSVAYAAHLMVWDSLELIPVVENKNLKGIISRSDVIKTLQSASRQPHVSETFEDMMVKDFSFEYTSEGVKFEGKVIPEMYSSVGAANASSLTMLMSIACTIALKQKNHNIYVDSFTIHFIKPIPVDTNITILATVIGSGRNYAKVDISMFDGSGGLCSKGMMSAKIMKKK